MKNIYKLCSLALLLTMIVSCDREKIDTDFVNDRDNSIFFQSSSRTLFVRPTGENTTTINVSSVSIADGTIPFTITVDPTSTAVEGVDFDIISNTEISGGSITSSFVIEAYFEASETDGKTAILKLNAADGVNIGVKDTFTLELFKLCPFDDGLITTSYTAEVFAFGESAPGYDITLQPVAGEANTWSVSTGWGTTFVSWATGDPSFDGAFIYSGTITVNPDDFSITFNGDDGWATGGTGVFSPCTQVFSYTLTQALFTSPFTVDVVLTPVP
jgi:hypothetical protein